ncbi:hypothetical protein [Pseudomonas phage D6]|nr:hypothetical protein [Pseudomonas phage D6]
MQLSELRSLLRTVPNTHEITSIYRNQMFGMCDASENVSFFALEYNIEMSTRGRIDTVAPALIFDGFRERDDQQGDRYIERKAACIKIDELLRGAGYVKASCMWHAHEQGDMVRCEYYKAGGDGYTGSSLLVVYSPTDYMPEGAIVVHKKGNRGPLEGIYYTPGFEEGQLTYVGAAELNGRPVRTITLSAIEGKVWWGEPMVSEWLKQVDGFGLARVTSMTQSETQEGWKREYTGHLLRSQGGHAVQVVVQNHHFSN